MDYSTHHRLICMLNDEDCYLQLQKVDRKMSLFVQPIKPIVCSLLLSMSLNGVSSSCPILRFNNSGSILSAF